MKPSEVTNFQAPSSDIEFEELKPLLVKHDETVIVIEDPNYPPIEPRAVECCTCVTGITVCIPEQQDGQYMTSVGAHGAAFWYG